MAFDVTTGDLLWEHRYEAPYTVYLYAIGPGCTFDRLCRAGLRPWRRGSSAGKASTGEVLWARHHQPIMASPFRNGVMPLTRGRWGSGDLHGGGDGSTVVSLDRHTGEERWRSFLRTSQVLPPVR